MLTPREYAFATPADLGGTRAYQSFCKQAGLPITEDGYGLLLCEDEYGRRVTLAGEADYAHMIRDAGDAVRSELAIPAERFPLRRDRWPDQWPDAHEQRGRRAGVDPWQPRQP